ncbi:hypothetical protein [Branchiibius cervicis]|uniref:DUF1707 domain-containing protein n=1 Tax=Branchiibius cervicis TaxID=908252 RepID=A0ABW2AX08_9MICO
MTRKDVDELELAVVQGRFTRQQADELIEKLVEAEEVVRAGAAPFNQGWETFAPDPDWPVPTLLS